MGSFFSTNTLTNLLVHSSGNVLFVEKKAMTGEILESTLKTFTSLDLICIPANTVTRTSPREIVWIITFPWPISQRIIKWQYLWNYGTFNDVPCFPKCPSTQTWNVFWNKLFLVLIVVTFLGAELDFNDPEELFQFVLRDEQKLPDVPNNYNYFCRICSKRFISRVATRNHVESIHYPGMFKYTCHLCGKECASKSAVNYHITTFHNKKQ